MPENNKVDPALLKYWQDAGFPQYTPREDTIIEIKSKEPLKTQKEANKERSKYFHPIKGATERWNSSWSNNTNPVKASLDSGLASFIPGLKMAQLAYDGYKSYNNLVSDNGYRKTVNEFKSGNYGKGTLSLLGDILDVTSSLDPAEEALFKSKEYVLKPFLRRNPILVDRTQGAKDLFKYRNSPNLINNTPHIVSSQDRGFIHDKLPFSAKEFKIDGTVDRYYTPDERVEMRFADKNPKGRVIITYNKGKDDSIADIYSEAPNTLNLHMTKNTKGYGKDLIRKSPAGTYIGDLQAVEGFDRSIGTLGQQAIKKFQDTNNMTEAFRVLFKKDNSVTPINLSSDSYRMMLKSAGNPKRGNFELRYIPDKYAPLNEYGNMDLLEKMKGLPLYDQLQIATNYVLKANPNARLPKIVNGEVVFPIPVLLKTK